MFSHGIVRNVHDDIISNYISQDDIIPEEISTGLTQPMQQLSLETDEVFSAAASDQAYATTTGTLSAAATSSTLVSSSQWLHAIGNQQRPTTCRSS